MAVRDRKAAGLMRVAIATTQVPFVRGGAEIHAEGLQHALREAGHDAEIVALPFQERPPERIADAMLACRLVDLTESAGTPIDLVIGLKFPAYLIPHPNKVLWILHQYRQAYDLWEHPMGDLHIHDSGDFIRAAIRQADLRVAGEARAVYANSGNVAKRLRQYCDVGSTPLYHPPPGASRYYCGEAQEYLLFPSRITTIKRQALVLEALARTRQPVRVRFAGTPDNPWYANKCFKLVEELGIGDRVAWEGAVSDEQKIALYAHALAVIFPPVDEDLGYVTLEAMLAGKPVLTCRDSGGPLEFVLHGVTGYVVEPSPDALAGAMDAIWADRTGAQQMGEAGRDRYAECDISWAHAVERLLA